MPAAGQHVLVGGRPGLCFKVSLPAHKQQLFGVVHDDSAASWMGYMPQQPWTPCPESRQINIRGVIMNQQGHHWPEAWLYGQSSMCSPDDAQPWTLFEELKWPPPSKIHALPERGTPSARGQGWRHGELPREDVDARLHPSPHRRLRPHFRLSRADATTPPQQPRGESLVRRRGAAGWGADVDSGFV